MINEFKKRFLTSIILFLLTIFLVFFNYDFFIFSLLLVSFFSIKEMYFLISKIIKKKKIYNILFFNLISIIFFLFFFLSCKNIYLDLGDKFFFYILLICIFSDIGGYIVGKTIGGVKITKISPNKTLSGSIGSLIFSLLPLLIYINLFNQNFILNSDNFIFCILISLVTQFGDLIISYIKRIAKVKDTGRVLPGHGGLLDRIDGIIFAIPFSYLVINLIL